MGLVASLWRFFSMQSTIYNNTPTDLGPDMVHAVKKGQLFESPISHLIVAGKRKEKRRMKDLRKMFHAPNFD
jgi:hypothetical protein